MECASMSGMPVFSLVLTASISPTNTDESVMANMCLTDHALGLQGNVLRLIRGLPGYRLVHFFDNGFK